MNKSKIEWCDSTWNPVTGCLHGCEYCYARRTAERFMCEASNASEALKTVWREYAKGLQDMYFLRHQVYGLTQSGKEKKEPYPFGFAPTFHCYKLDEPQHWKKPRTIFVCSMADLFGNWVPDEWIEDVFAACEKAPQHRYLFLTKNPSRYDKLALLGKLPTSDNYWYGSTITNTDDPFWCSGSHNTFISVEPILSDFPHGKVLPSDLVDWVIIGAMTGSGSKKHQPTPETVYNIATAIGPVFMKDSILPIIGEENMRREFPWKMKGE